MDKLKAAKIVFLISTLLFVSLVIFYFVLNQGNNFIVVDEQGEENQEEKNEDNFINNFEEAIEKLENPQGVVNFLSDNFKLIPREGNVPYSPQDFFEIKEGGHQDFANFITFYLYQNDFVSFIFSYEYFDNDDQKREGYVAFFREEDLPKYAYFDNEGKGHIVHYGWSVRELHKKEEERIGFKITKYGTVPPLSADLVPTEWISP